MSIQIPADNQPVERKRTACVIALSHIPSDPRVRRQCDALFEAGWDVVAVGVPGIPDPTCRWPIRVKGEDEGTSDVTVEPGPSQSPAFATRSLKQKVLSVCDDRLARLIERVALRLIKPRTLLGKIRYRLVGRPMMFLRLNRQPKYAESVYWSWPNIQQLFEAGQTVKADLWLANDWTALPVAARLAERNGGIYVYDSHEFAFTEYAHDWRWRLLSRPIVSQAEKKHIFGAKVVSTVSSGIADALQDLYDLPVKPVVIRNAPQYSSSSFRPTGAQIRLLYHGIVAPGRGLEETIASVPLWREEFSFSIRGPGDVAYLQGLQDLIRSMKLDARVMILPPVAMIDLVERAREFDVGFFALKGHSLQNHFVLPNKFFEYTMAGLALCVSDLPEMTRLCQQYKHGVVFQGLSRETIASAVNNLSATEVDRMKRNSIVASSDLCWGNETGRMLDLYNKALAG